MGLFYSTTAESLFEDAVNMNATENKQIRENGSFRVGRESGSTAKREDDRAANVYF